jgi:hypothetical protein
MLYVQMDQRLKVALIIVLLQQFIALKIALAIRQPIIIAASHVLVGANVLAFQEMLIGMTHAAIGSHS